MGDEPQTNGLTREQKVGAVLLLLFGILTVGLGGLQLRNTVYGPFAQKKVIPENQLVYDEGARLKQIDTDHDGINDYDELNTYGTSPYLPDTDSDGVGDKAEIDRGTDPSCPEGRVCSAGDDVLLVTSTPAFAEPELGKAEYQNILNNGASGQMSVDQASALAKDPKALREVLRQSGKISDVDLAKIDDATLQSIANDLVQSVATDKSTLNTVTQNQ